MKCVGVNQKSTWVAFLYYSLVHVIPYLAYSFSRFVITDATVFPHSSAGLEVLKSKCLKLGLAVSVSPWLAVAILSSLAYLHGSYFTFYRTQSYGFRTHPTDLILTFLPL